MKHGFTDYSANIWPLILVIGSLWLTNPESASITNLGLGLYIGAVDLQAMVYILHICCLADMQTFVNTPAE